MSEQKYIAIVGIGSIGSRHIGNLLAMGYYNLVGVDTRTIQHEERLSIVSTFEDLEPWGISHALICSPPSFHYHHAKHFLERGIPTFIEKPMTQSSLEARVLNELAKDAGTYIGVGYMERAHHEVLRASEFVKQYGCEKAEICCYWQCSEKSYPLDTAQESSHAIDTALFLLGDVRHVRHEVHGNEVIVWTEHTNGTKCIIRMNMRDRPRRIIDLSSCANGKHLSMLYGNTASEWNVCYISELQSFLDGKPLCTGEDGLKVVEILESIQ